MKKVLFGFILLMLSTAHAAREPLYIFSGAIGASRSTNLIDHKDGTAADAVDLNSALYLTTPIGTFSTAIGHSTGLNQASEESTGWQDSFLGYSSKPQAWKLGENYNLQQVPGAKLVIPLSIQSRNVDRMKTAAILSLNYLLKPIPRKYSLLNDISLHWSLSAGQNFHDYESTTDGAILNKFSSNQGIGLAAAFKNITVTVDYVHKNRWSYQNQSRESFSFSEEITYTHKKVWSVAIGHDNSGNALKPNGEDSNLSVLDEDQSMVYLSTSYVF